MSGVNYSFMSTHNAREIFYENFIYSQNYCQKTAERKLLKKQCLQYFLLFEIFEPGVYPRSKKLTYFIQDFESKHGLLLLNNCDKIQWDNALLDGIITTFDVQSQRNVNALRCTTEISNEYSKR